MKGVNAMHPLKRLIADRKSGKPRGVYSACSASPYVLEAVIQRAVETGTEALIESTANQVNQFGGYTGMAPDNFAAFVDGVARKYDFPRDRLILGGDHLGPLTWQSEPEASAMEKSEELIRRYILAGFTKIHIDTSMRVSDDNAALRLSDEKISARAARLVKKAEESYVQLKARDPGALRPVYVIGSEVPIPGGVQEEEAVSVTKPEDFKKTVDAFKAAFEEYGISDAWDNVVAVVVQPGVEFGDEMVHEYDRSKAKALVGALKDYPELVFEGHSTDYQTSEKIREMVEDGIAILKVGPALTFAQREAMFALAMMEEELLYGNKNVELSNFRAVLEKAMFDNPSYWKKHYHGERNTLAFKCKYSFSDRCRYYFPEPQVRQAIGRMMGNLRTTKIPLSLISQYMPVQYAKIRKGMLCVDPEALLRDRIINTIDKYLGAMEP